MLCSECLGKTQNYPLVPVAFIVSCTRQKTEGLGCRFALTEVCLKHKGTHLLHEERVSPMPGGEQDRRMPAVASKSVVHAWLLAAQRLRVSCVIFGLSSYPIPSLHSHRLSHLCHCLCAFTFISTLADCSLTPAMLRSDSKPVRPAHNSIC